MNRFFKYGLPPILWALVIFSFSSFTVGVSNEVYVKDFVVKKTVHMIEYAILSILIYRGFINYGLGKNKSLFLSLLFAGLYAVSDEFHQSFTPGREPKVRDVLIDLTGSFVALYVIVNRLKNMPKLVSGFFQQLEIN